MNIIDTSAPTCAHSDNDTLQLTPNGSEAVEEWRHAVEHLEHALHGCDVDYIVGLTELVKRRKRIRSGSRHKAIVIGVESC